MDEGRHCALPGCERVISPTDGRPERRYCTAAHRTAARQARRAAARAEQGGPDPLTDALPWLRGATEPAAGDTVGSAEAPAAAPPDPSACRSRDRRGRRSRGRVLAALGVAGILAGGYAAVEPVRVPAAVEATPQWETADAWATRATVALASVNRQLDALAQAEEEWQQLPESRRVVVPAPVVALWERRSVLERRRAMLQSQLDAYRSLRRAQQELAVSEQQLRAVEKALADGVADRRGAAQDGATAALEEQRDLRLRRRDAQRAELASLEEGVAAAARAPLPDDVEATETVSRELREVVRRDGTAPDPDPAQRDGPGGSGADGAERRGGAGEPGESGSEAETGGATPAPEDPATGSGSADPTSDAPRPAEPSHRQDDEETDEETVAELRRRAAEVAREARRAEATATPWMSQ